MRPPRRTHALLVTVTALTAGAVGAAPAQAAKKKLPVVSFVSPMTASVGDTLTIKGHNFRPGKGKNTVVLKRDGGKAVFIKAGAASAKKLKVKLPQALAPQFAKAEGVPQPARFRIRVLARSFGKRFTDLGQSPLLIPTGYVPPVKPGETPTIPPVTPDGDCDQDGTKNGVDLDDDDDLLQDTEEDAAKLNPCGKDTDGDGVDDVYEYVSALDLNGANLPFPGKRPYPNALDPDDAKVDHDGDSLTLMEEFRLWSKLGGGSRTLNYSAGKQRSQTVSVLERLGTTDFDGGGVSPAEARYLDTDGNGFLGDDELDADGDGLSNWAEAHGTLTREWWKLKSTYGKAWKEGGEGDYPLTYAPLDLEDRDSDGDQLVDGADDSDFDGVSNLLELNRFLAGAGADPKPLTGRVHPFNPCLPAVSNTCQIYVQLDDDGNPPYGRGDDGRGVLYPFTF